MTSKCVISLDLPEDIVARLRDQFDLQTWSGKEAMPEVTLQDWLADAEGLLCALSTPDHGIRHRGCCAIKGDFNHLGGR